MALKDDLRPDVMVESYGTLTVPVLQRLKLRALVLDIDNTLAACREILPSPSLLAWIDSLKTGGIRLAIVSNAGRKRTGRFADSMGIAGFARSGKPAVHALLEAMRQLETAPEETGLLGDQLFTDILGANRAGMTSILVKPVCYWYEPPQVVLKRFPEFFLRWYFKRHPHVIRIAKGDPAWE